MASLLGFLGEVIANCLSKFGFAFLTLCYGSAALAQPVDVSYFKLPATVLTVGGHPHDWGTTFTHVRDDVRVEGGGANADPTACPGPDAGKVFQWLSNPAVQCGLNGATYDLYTATDGTWLYVSAVVYDNTRFVAGSQAPSWWRRDSLEVRISTNGHAPYQHNGGSQPGIFIASLQRDGGTANNYPETDANFVEGVNWQRWTGFDVGASYVVGLRVKLSVFGAAAGTLPVLRLNVDAKNQIMASNDLDANRVWLAGDLSQNTWPAQFENIGNWAALTPMVSAYGPIKFENRAVGNYNFSGVNADFGNYANLTNSWGVIALFGAYKDDTAIVNSDALYGHSLQITYPTGGYSGTSGAGWRARFAAPSTRAMVSYMVKFQPNFQFKLGGKLHGLCSDVCPSDGAAVSSGFSVRFMWRPVATGSGARLVAYVYHPEMPWTYGQDFPLLINPPAMTLQAGGAGNVLADGQIYGPFDYGAADTMAGRSVARVYEGMWYRLDLDATVNTPSQRDGRIRAWINGTLALDVGGFDFRYTGADTQQLARYGLFQTFHGGEGSQWAPTANVYALFDDFAFWMQ